MPAIHHELYKQLRILRFFQHFVLIFLWLSTAAVLRWFARLECRSNDRDFFSFLVSFSIAICGEWMDFTWMCDWEGAFLKGGFFFTPIAGSIGIFDTTRIESDFTTGFNWSLPDVDATDTDADDSEGVTDAFEIFLYRWSFGLLTGVESSMLLITDDS